MHEYRTYQRVGYRYGGRTELTEVSDTGNEVVPNLPKYRLPVFSAYRTRKYNGVFDRILRSTGSLGFLGKGVPVPGVCLRIDFPNLPRCHRTSPKCRVPIYVEAIPMIFYTYKMHGAHNTTNFYYYRSTNIKQAVATRLRVWASVQTSTSGSDCPLPTTPAATIRSSNLLPKP